MPNITPSSTVKMYSNIAIAGDEQIAFASKAEQDTYFAKHLNNSVVNCSYIRKTGKLRLEVSMATAMSCNYIAFNNTAFENKTIYARISYPEYVNNVTTDVFYNIDWFQTFMFDFSVNDAFIDREQLSERDYTRAKTKPALTCQDIYQLISPEGLAVNSECFDFTQPVFAPVALDPSHDAEAITKLKDGSDSCVLFQLALPASSVFNYESVSGDMTEYGDFNITYDGQTKPGSLRESTYDDKGTAIAYAKILKLLDRFNPIMYNKTNRLPNTLLLGYIDLSKQNSLTEFYDSTTSHSKMSPIERLRAILDILAINDMTSVLVGYYGVPRYLAEVSGCIYYIQGKYNDIHDTTGQAIETVNVNLKAKVDEENFFFTIDGMNMIVPYVADENYHPKVNMYPYTYATVSTPGDDTKEYKYEWFHTKTENGDVEPPRLNMKTNCLGVPYAMMAPVDYKELTRLNDGYSSGIVVPDNPLDNQEAKRFLNYAERVEWQSSPQVPYTTDNYLSYLSQVYGTTIGAYNTYEQKRNALDITRDIIGLATGSANNAAALASSTPSTNHFNQMTYNSNGTGSGNITDTRTGGSPLAALNAVSSEAQAINSFQQGMLNREQRDETIAEGRQTRSNPSLAAESAYSVAQSQYVADDYHPGNGSYIGIQSFYMNSVGNSNPAGAYFRVSQKKLRKPIAERYSDYFEMYGCNTARTGVPYVCNYIKGVTDTSKIPHFSAVGVNSYTQTYVKTQNMSIIAPYQIAANAIENMFNSGIKLLKGSDL